MEEPPPPSELAKIRQAADRGEWETAAEDCRNFLAREKLNPVAHFYHALVLTQMGKEEEAEQSLRNALYLDRNFALAHYYLGLCLEKREASPAAARSFQNVLNLLAKAGPDETFAEWDGITAADLKELAEMNLSLLQDGQT
jgi:chemotaxis protein methyltransferase CheR